MNSCLRILTLLLAVSVAACATPMPSARQTKVDGMLLYGIVNLSTSADLTSRAMRTPDMVSHCKISTDLWCTNSANFDFVNLLLMNTYFGGLRAIGTFAPSDEKILKGDIVVVRFRAGTTAEFVRVASRGERPDCRWDGGGIGRALSSAGVVCEKYDWRSLRSYFYD